MKEKEYTSTGDVFAEGYYRRNIPASKMTKNDVFDQNGFLFVPKLILDPESLYCNPPVDNNGNRITGRYTYQRKDKVLYANDEGQVPGSLATYNNPQYKELHFGLKKPLEQILGIDLFPTYYYDRFYYVGQRLKRHWDRPACEISVTLQISTNSKEPWPIWFERPDGSNAYVNMENGDFVIYKGCEREHWRDPLNSRYNKVERLWRKVRGKEDDTYHHQLFFHYVNAQGPYVEYAYDRM